MKLVFNTESEEPELLGQYFSTDEDSISYIVPGSGHVEWANSDSVAIVTVDISYLPNYKKLA